MTEAQSTSAATAKAEATHPTHGSAARQPFAPNARERAAPSETANSVAPKRLVLKNLAMPAPSDIKPISEARWMAIGWAGVLLVMLVCFCGFKPGPQRATLSIARPLPQSMDAQVAARSPEELREETSQALLEMMNHPVAAVRAKVLAALIKRGAVAELLELRQHPALGVRAAVPAALAQLGRPGFEYLPRIADGLQSPDEAVRNSSQRAIEQLTAQFGQHPESARWAATLGTGRDVVRQ